MAAKPVRVLLIGAGSVGCRHRRAYDCLSGVKLVGVVDPFFASDTTDGVRRWRRLDDVSTMEYDAIDICTPTYLHKNYVLKAAQLDKAVFCESPPASNLDDTVAMVEAMRHRQLPLAFSQRTRWHPAFIESKRLIEAGIVGRSAMLRISRSAPVPYGWNGWYRNRQLSEGIIIESLYQDVEFALWALGDVNRVYLVDSIDEVTGAEWAGLTMRFHRGALAYLSSCWTQADSRVSLELAGSSGMFSYDSADSQSLKLTIEDPEEAGDTSACLKAWVKSVGAQQPTDNGTEVCDVMEVMQAMIASNRLRKSVDLVPAKVRKPDGGDGP